jgi:hypothetical protein
VLLLQLNWPGWLQQQWLQLLGAVGGPAAACWNMQGLRYALLLLLLLLLLASAVVCCAVACSSIYSTNLHCWLLHVIVC